MVANEAIDALEPEISDLQAQSDAARAAASESVAEFVFPTIRNLDTEIVKLLVRLGQLNREKYEILDRVKADGFALVGPLGEGLWTGQLGRADVAGDWLSVILSEARQLGITSADDVESDFVEGASQPESVREQMAVEDSARADAQKSAVRRVLEKAIRPLAPVRSRIGDLMPGRERARGADAAGSAS